MTPQPDRAALLALVRALAKAAARADDAREREAPPAEKAA